MISMPKRENIISSFLLSLNKNCYRAFLFSALILFLGFYPGQNYYQVLQIFWKPPETIFLPKELLFSPALYPSVKGIVAVPSITAKAAIVMDIPSAVVLYQKNPYMTLSPASTTKIMTALVALDYYRLDDVLSVDRLETEGAMMGLSLEDKVTVKNLLYGLLINSGNDAALVLADHFPGGKSAFINEMNKKAQDFSLIRTHFANVNGFSESDHYTTALDLARLAAISLQNSVFSQIVSTKSVVVSDIYHTKSYPLENINKLLGVVPGITGIKTGWTTEAGECLVASAERNGQKIISVVLGSNNRFLDTQDLLEWGFSNFTWKEVQASQR